MAAACTADGPGSASEPSLEPTSTRPTAKTVSSAVPSTATRRNQ